jgi:hypothetical protein
MPYKTISLGLTLTVPTNGTTNWGTNLEKQAWESISSHDHTTGSGQQIPAGGIVDLAITTAKINDLAVTAAKIANNTITAAQLSLNLGGNQAATMTPLATTQIIDFDTGNKQILDLSSATGSVTLTLSNPQSGADYRIEILQGGTVRTLVWPAAVIWPQGEEPSQYHEASTTNVVTLDYDGTNYLGKWELNLS